MGEGERRRVTLTFDNGPTPGVTDDVLDVLASQKVLATFFVVGTQLRAPGGMALARRARDEGHLVGHHTMTHTVLLGAAPDPDAAVDAEIAALAADMEALDGGERLFRPYAAGGVLDRCVLSEAAVRHLQAGGYTCALWNSVPHDWDDPDGWPDRARRDIDTHDWTVVVLHDIDSGAMAHLARFIDDLRSDGIAVTRDLPEACTPIRHGRVAGPLSHLMPLCPTPT